MGWVSIGCLVRWVSVAGWWDDEGEEALLLYWIVRHFCWCESPLRHFCWWGSEACLLISQNLMSESYVMIGQSWAVRSYWSEPDDWILLEFSCLNRELWLVRTWWANSSWVFWLNHELWLVRTWWANSSWDFWLNRASWLARLLFLNPACWLVGTWWLNRTWWLVRVNYVRLWTRTMD